MNLDSEDWKDSIIEALIEAFENGDLIFEQEEIVHIVEDCINRKFENEEFDEDIRDELLENSIDIANHISSEYGPIDLDEETDVE
ncbi:MAG: hypothetical protein ABIA04_04725 [Pseudomonadota bacterium]